MTHSRSLLSLLAGLALIAPLFAEPTGNSGFPGEGGKAQGVFRKWALESFGK